MINTFTILGRVLSFNASTPRKEGAPESGLLLVQYDQSRERVPGTGPLSFTSDVFVRVPSSKFPRLRELIKAGDLVQVSGHVQGMSRNGPNDSATEYRSVELVANRVHVEDMQRMFGESL